MCKAARWIQREGGLWDGVDVGGLEDAGAKAWCKARIGVEDGKLVFLLQLHAEWSVDASQPTPIRCRAAACTPLRLHGGKSSSSRAGSTAHEPASLLQRWPGAGNPPRRGRSPSARQSAPAA
jgi:hypothetical protein